MVGRMIRLVLRTRPLSLGVDRMRSGVARSAGIALMAVGLLWLGRVDAASDTKTFAASQCAPSSEVGDWRNLRFYANGIVNYGSGDARVACSIPWDGQSYLDAELMVGFYVADDVPASTACRLWSADGEIMEKSLTITSPWSWFTMHWEAVPSMGSDHVRLECDLSPFVHMDHIILVERVATD